MKLQTLWRSAAKALAGIGITACLLAAITAWLAPEPAHAQTGSIGFDHQTTGFPLTGLHQDVRCETCHIKGIFKSTPRDCAVCHIENNPRSAVSKPVNHLPTTQGCDACHTTSTFGGARFDHVMALPGTCSTCHNNVVTTGKSANHVATLASCDQCHNTVSFAAIRVPANHIPLQASARCESCHVNVATSGSFAGAQMDHTGYTSNCAQCHAPSVASTFFGVQIMSSLTAPPHIPSSDNCETCHTAVPAMPIPVTGAASVGGTTFAGGRMSHAGITSNCSLCHGPNVVTGTFFGVTPKTNAGLSPPHLPSSTTCESCHANAIPAQLIPPAGAAAVGGTTFANGQMNHAGITGGCVSCHGPTITGTSFFGVSSIVVMPPTSPVGPTSHIPSGNNCEQCHIASMPSGPIAPVASKTPPGTRFATPAPTTAQIHSGVTSGCNACHEAGNSWMGMSAYPIAPTVKTTGAQYTGFQTRPRAAAGTFNVADATHPATGDCSQCHSGTNYFTAQDKPANHIPYVASAQCTACHTAAPDYAAMPTLANIHANAPSTTSNCAQCHGAAAASFAIPAANFSIVGLPNNHLPTGASCEQCHVGAGSSIAATPVGNGAKFSGSLMNHAGIATNCAACHVPAGTPATFAGVTSIVGMPPTSPAGAGSHIPSGTACEQCHLGSIPSGLVAPVASKAPPGTGFATPVPTTVQIHSGVTGGCNACHEANSVWLGMSSYPIAPTVKTANAQYTGFHTRPRAAAGTFNVADATHPATGDCSQCHSGTNFFTGQDKPANHIPYAASAVCTACHTNGSDYSVMPTLANIHANAQSTTGNCAQCHGAAAASFAIPAANFSIVGLPSNHLPTTAPCEQCHVGTGSSVPVLPVPNGAKFSGSKMSHTGLTTNCVACHVPAGTPASFAGITSIVGMPPTSPVGAGSHIPSSNTCEACHAGTLANVSGLIAANATKTAPGTLFATPAPTTAQIHSGVTSGCSSCHEASFVWMGMTAYPIAPTVKTLGAQYTGFQTRPRAAAGTFNVADASHPATGDCSQCHSGTNYFTSADKPTNHIPTAANAQCTACHTAAPDYSAMPTLANIHANAPSTTSNCAQCHGAAAASFAIPAANFSIVGLPTNHLPTTASCESCHVGTGSSVPVLPVPNGAKFSGSRMSHTGITTNCVACHVPAGTTASFAGITSIVGMPPTSPMGASSHIPSNTTCEACHAGTLANVGGLIAANATKTAPGTLFATPAPTTAQIHGGVTSGCSSCHEASFVWMGMSAYPIAPTVKTLNAQYTGFHTRPRSAAGTFNVADATHPATGDCSQCHSGTNFFSGQDKPANHIPYAASAQCAACHTSTDYSVMPTLANIHANAQSTTANCAQCHGAAAASFAIPAANFSIVGLPTNHLPTTASCESCHVGTGSSVPVLPVPNGAKFSGSRMSHAGITTNCVTCHVPAGTSASFAGITSIVGMPPTSPVGASSHIPSSTTCESCHLGTLANVPGLIPANASKTAPGTAFATPAPTTTQIHGGITSGCSNCHEASFVWMGMSAYPISPATKTLGAQYTGFHTRPRAAAGTFNVADATHPATGDCSQCHSGTNFFSSVDKPANHIPTAPTAQCTACHTSTDYSVMPTLANIHANAPSTTANCAQCHGAAAPSFAIPAANFSIVGLPTNHLPTTAPCEQCHVGTGSSVPVLPVPNGAKFSGSRMSHTGITTNCVACHVPAGTALNFAGITSIVGMPPTSPMGASSHIPSSNTCEACHAGTLANVGGLIAANATKTAPGTLFATPAPNTTQIHAGVTSGCNACHEANYLWMGMSAYPISPTTLTAGASYVGFQTRPRTAAGTFNVADAAHPVNGDCSDCHTSTTAFTAQAKPTGHIPTTQACGTCHVSGSDFSIAGLTTNLATLHTGITSGCAACHTAGTGAGPFAGCATQATCASPPPLTYQPKTMPLAAGGSPTAPSKQTHVPVGAVACEKCHSPTVFTSFAGMNMKNNSTAHGAVSTATCITCHEGGPPAYTWFGVTIVTRPVGHQGRKAGQDCAGSGCHSRTNFNNFNAAVLRPILRAARVSGGPGRLPGLVPVPTGALSAGPALAFDHTGVLPGQCMSCHNGVAARGLPVKHLATKTSCDTCHRTTAWKPAQFSHQGVLPGQCISCHNGAKATGKPGNHFVTARSCDSCHRTLGWLPVTYAHLSPAYTPAVDKPNCVSCHVTNGEMIPRLMHGNPRVRPVPVPPGP